jgi:hypothetical protein
MSSAIGGGAATVGLASLSVLERLTTEGSLVDLASVSSREGHTIRLELVHGTDCLSAHVVDRVLVACLHAINIENGSRKST